jgi:N-acetylmuramoyl-L-alanine amidase
MNRLRARAFSALLALAVLLAAGGPGLAQDRTPSFWFAGTRLIFDRAVPLDGDVAVATHDGGLARFLARLGATIAYQPQQRYVVVTAADRRTIAFTLGTAQYTVGGLGARAAFAPFVDGNDAIVPLYALARALYVEPVADGNDTVLQPQIGALDVRTDGRRTTVVIRGATALAYVKRIETPEHVELAFSGVGSALAGMKRSGALASVTVTSGGPPKNPTTIVALDAPHGTTHEFVTPASPFELGLAFTPPGGASPIALAPPTASPVTAPVFAPPAASPAIAPPPVTGLATPPPIPPVGDATSAAAATHAVVTGILLQPQGDGLQIRVTVSGSTAYEWHRLADQRWYIDLQNAVLTDAGRDERPAVAAVDSVRIRQTGTADAPSVRIALTLRGDRRVDVTPLADGLSILAVDLDAIAALRSGSGRVGIDVAAAASPAPSDLPPSDVPTPWKFGPIVPGSRIIVIDPGHGGDDHGTEHNGLSEKVITLDIARRLRSLLLAQGWTVRMTRDSDIDPVSNQNLALMRADGKPNPEDRAYLQTRTDVANTVNARMFISIHVNYSPSASVNGTTFYWYKPQDLALAQAMERAVIPVANTNDVGTRHENLYVVRHATMPAVLIETAFISNPGDADRLRSQSFLQSMAVGIANGVRAFAGAAPIQASQVDR